MRRKPVAARAAVETFARFARPLLASDAVRHTVELTVLDALCRGGWGAAVC